MKLSIKKNNRIIAFTLLCVFVLIIILFSVFNNMVNEQLYLAIESELNGIIKQQQLTINNENKNNSNSLSLLANTITEEQILSGNIAEYLNKQSKYFETEDIHFVDMNANGISKDNEIEDFSDNVAYKQAVATGENASGANKNSTTQNGIMDIAVPVYDDDEMIGVLVGTNHVNKVFDDISNSVAGTATVMIVDSSGTIVVSSAEDFGSLSKLADPSVKFLRDTSHENAMYEIANGIPGVIYYSFGDSNRIAEYVPLDFGNQMLVVVADEAQMQVGIREISNILTFISVMSVCAFAAFVIYTWSVQRKNMNEIKKVAYIDELTGLPNLTKLKKDMATVLRNNPDKKYAIIKIDVINFKAINEIYGFEIGNKALCGFGKVAANVDEKSFMIARVGVDSFIFFSGNNFLEELDATTAYYEAIFKQLIPELENHHLSFAYGRYFIEPGETNVDDIINKVSLAHSMAKGKKDSVIWNYDDNYKKEVLFKTELTNKMEKSLENNEFHAFLQPKFDILKNELIGAEALVRWIEPSGNMIFPNDFIPHFEGNGFIINIDKYILEKVCMTLSRWKKEGKKLVPISVNFSRLHLENMNFVQEIAQIVDKYNLDHHLIEIELTETTLLENTRVLKKLIDDLHSSGFAISIDDFGAGHSSLGMIKEFNADVIKLDRSFVTRTENDTRGEVVVEGIVTMLHSLDSRVIVEGVEDAEQLEFLKSINCEEAQGYYFDKPIPIKEFEEKYL